jgi:flagellar protein FliO/FliZ
MPTSTIVSSALWFLAILALIPLALWLLKRTPAGGAGAMGWLRNVAVLPLGPGQRVAIVEIGRGDARRWLVLGVTGERIERLHEMAAQDDASTPMQAAAPFSQWLSRLQGGTNGGPAGGMKEDDAR